MTCTSPRIRLGVIGLGLIAQTVHLPNLQTLREVFELGAVCDLSETLARQVAAEWGAGRWTTSPAEVLADPAIDAVLLLTPGSHEDLARAALEAGKHVLAEKPFAHTAGASRALDQLAAGRGLVLQVGYMKLYEPLLPTLRAALPALGDLRLVRVTVLHPADEPQYDHQRYLRYSDAPKAALADGAAAEAAHVAASIGPVGEPLSSLWANVLTGSVCHEFSLLRGVFGEQPLHIDYADLGPHGSVRAGRALEEPPQIQALGALGGAQLALSWNWLPDHPEYTEELALFGSAGRASLSLPVPYARDARARLVIDTADGAHRTSTAHRANHTTAFVRELEAFAGAIGRGEPVVSTGAGAAWDVTGLHSLARAIGRQLGVTLGGEAAREEER
jgi:predicted dehydrogenase